MHPAKLSHAIVVAISVLTVPVCNAQTYSVPKTIRFAVSTVKPSHAPGWSSRFTPTGFSGTGVSLQWVVMQNAYNIYDIKRVAGAPSWFDSDKFDIEAKVDEADAEAFKNFTQEQRQEILQSFLADRFKLIVHHEMKDFPVYALVVAKSGPKLIETKPEEIRRNSMGGIVSIVKNTRGGNFEVDAATMQSLAEVLSRFPDVGRIVIDKTELTGRYNIALYRTPADTPADSPLAGGPSIFTALQEQLGLKLEPTKAPVDVLVIDHAERPSEN